MTKKTTQLTSLVRAGTSALAPTAQTTGQMTRTQKDIVEQTDTHLLKMQGVTQKALYAAHCLHTVHDAADNHNYQAAAQASALNEAAQGMVYQGKVETFNTYNLDLLQQNLCAIEDRLGECLHQQVGQSYSERKRGLFG